MQTELVPIFKLRELFLRELNPTFFNHQSDIIHRSALAAQDYVLSGTYKEYKTYMGLNFKNLPGYTAVHQKYNLPYNPKLPVSQNTALNPGLVMDLAWSFDIDIKNGIIDSVGNIRKPDALSKSEVMHTYHNNHSSGTPVCALELLLPSQLNKIFSQTLQHHK